MDGRPRRRAAYGCVLVRGAVALGAVLFSDGNVGFGLQCGLGSVAKVREDMKEVEMRQLAEAAAVAIAGLRERYSEAPGWRLWADEFGGASIVIATDASAQDGRGGRVGT